MLFKAALCLFNLGLALAAPSQEIKRTTGRTSPPSGALVVGSGKTYSKIQDAVNALSTSSSTAQSIFIESGTYSEQVTIPSLKSALTVYGYTTDTSAYGSNAVTISSGLGLSDVTNDDETATLRVHTSNFKMYNVNVENTRGKGDIALALSAYATNQGYYACQFIGYQDTVLAQTGYQVFAKSYIEGNTDFIFGQSAEAWFHGCDIRVPTSTLGYVTASGRSSSSSASYYVLDNCDIAAKKGATIAAGAIYLGRPWESYARVAVQDTSMSDIINAKGWAEWSTTSPNTGNVVFGEFGNSGDGASGERAFETKLSAAIGITSILGSSYASAAYVDTSYL
ncbi:carbohydrate esterase family 8 protein [Delphinella strobiligena]|nr:carbohydrate esterase family 8 protein [Delphinella strobiligena]